MSRIYARPFKQQRAVFRTLAECLGAPLGREAPAELVAAILSAPGGR
jgi:hypothetical protein